MPTPVTSDIIATIYFTTKIGGGKKKVVIGEWIENSSQCSVLREHTECRSRNSEEKGLSQHSRNQGDICQGGNDLIANHAGDPMR